MKLTRLVVKNFRGIGTGENGEGVTVKFDNNNLIFLIGQNNAGKSTLMEAYDFFVTAEREAHLSDFHKLDEANRIEIEGWLQAENDEDRNHPAVKAWLNEKDIAKVKKIWSKTGEKGKKETFNPTTELWDKDGLGGFDQYLQSVFPKIVWIRGMMTPKDALSSLNALTKKTLLKKLRETDVYSKAKSALETLQRTVQEMSYAKEIEEKLNDLMENTFPDISFKLAAETAEDFISKIMEGNTNVKVFRRDGTTDEKSEQTKIELDLDYFGHGVRRQFILNSFYGLSEKFAVAKKTRAKENEFQFEEEDSTETKSKMLLFEEPELYMHPDIIRSIRDLVYQLADFSEYQIMCTTHSPIVVDLAKPHSTLVRVELQDSQTIVRQVDSNIFEGEERQKMRMLKEFDPYVCEAFFSDNVLLVEGDTETVVVRTLFERLRKNGMLNSSQFIHVVNCGSKMNIPLFQKILRHFRINYYVFHDLDETYTKDGKKTSAWTMNERIWEEIEFAKKAGMSPRRFIFEKNFEDAHNYIYDKSDGKPYSAFKLTEQFDLDILTEPNESGYEIAPVVKFFLNIFGKYDMSEKFDSNFVSERVSKIPVNQSIN